MKLSYEDLSRNQNQTTNSTQTDGVGFFSLRNDGDEAIVRFMEDSVAGFDIQAVHPITVDGKSRKVVCLKDSPLDPVEKCPLCADGIDIQNRFFIKLIQYEKGADGVMVPKAKVWERSTVYAQKLKSYMDNYGMLSDVICKIIRHGRAGDTATTYEIIPNLSKTVYKDELFPKVPELFNGFKTTGRIIMDKTYDEVCEFLETGAFPQRNQGNEESRATGYEPPYTPPRVSTGDTQPRYESNAGFSTSQSQFSRPRRY